MPSKQYKVNVGGRRNFGDWQLVNKLSGGEHRAVVVDASRGEESKRWQLVPVKK